MGDEHARGQTARRGNARAGQTAQRALAVGAGLILALLAAEGVARPGRANDVPSRDSQ